MLILTLFEWKDSLAFINTNLSTLSRKSSFQNPSIQLKSSPLGDFFSGVTGSAPSVLEPPEELLLGTTIDPSKSNVDLACVYKASKDGWSAVNFHQCVDGRGSALVIALTSSGKRFGG